MSHPNSVIKSARAEAAVAGNRIVKYGTADAQVLQSAAATDLHVGVSTNLDTDAGDQVDIVKTGPAEVRLGASVTRGQKLTSDASGRAIAAAPAAGSNVQIVGIADASGVVDDIIPCTVAPSVMQG